MFPGAVMPLFVGRQISVQSLKQAILAKEPVVLACQRDAASQVTHFNDVHSVGTLAKVLHAFYLPDGSVKILIEGLHRVALKKLEVREGYYLMTVEECVPDDEVQRSSLLKSLKEAVAQYTHWFEFSVDVLSSLKTVDDPGDYADLLAAYMSISVEDKQDLLEIVSVYHRVERLLFFIQREIEWIQVDRRLQDRVREQINADQKNYFKREKLKAIQHELSDLGDEGSEIDQLELKIAGLSIPEWVADRLLAECTKLRTMPPMSSDSAMVRNYLELAVELPWGRRKRLNVNMQKANKRLERDHHGLTGVKERILEAIALQVQNQGRVRGPILCLVGPPGVGKTSLGAAIADALGRSFARIALGGVKDESEIRGHRRTYIGAMPGRILKAMRRVKYANPLILLDEIDKLGSDFRGDPAAALLEVLDPEQNKAFSDHYLELDYDLSDVFFVATANTLDIPPALLDRMEIIRLPGYTDQEKVQIASQHIMPKLFKECGMSRAALKIDANVLSVVIREYTREAGVRELERMIYKLCRQYVKRSQEGETVPRKLTEAITRQWLGVRRFDDTLLHYQPEVGVVKGLAWTAAGGEVLQIEALMFPGKGELILTGSLGEVMKESIRAAWSYVKSLALKKECTIEYFQQHDIHIHVPEGATPKDGPSAGVAIAVAMCSVVHKKAVLGTVAMTGEITLQGHVLKVGGIKEKLIAAHRYQIRTVFIPRENMEDLQEIPETIRDDMNIIGVLNAQEVLHQVFAEAH